MTVKWDAKHEGTVYIEAWRGRRQIGRLQAELVDAAAVRRGWSTRATFFREKECTRGLIAASDEAGVELWPCLVAWVDVSEEFRGTGLGVALYVKLAEVVAPMGYAIAPTWCHIGTGTSELAMRTWDSRGLASRLAVFGRVGYAGLRPGRRW